MIFILCLFFSICSTSLFAGDYAKPAYNGTTLTPENLLPTLSKESNMSPELQEKIGNWMSSNKELLVKLMTISQPNSLWRAEKQKNDECLQEKGYANKSRYNYVIDLPVKDENGKSYVMIISGGVNKINNVLAQQGLHGQPISKEQLDAVKVENTYQTASRALGYLLFLQTMKNINAQHIDTPKTYAMQLPEGDQTKPIDETTIIIQEKIEDAQPVTNCTQITKEELTELYIATRNVPIWNRPDLLRSAQAKRLFVLDLEQPNNTAQFMQRSKEGQERLSTISIQELTKFCAQCPEHLNGLKQLIKNDDQVIKQYHCYNDLVGTINEIKKSQSEAQKENL